MLPHRGTFFEFVPLEARESALADARPALGGRARPPVRHRRDHRLGALRLRARRHRALPVRNPPRIEFMGRLSGCLSVTQELTTHVEIERAVDHAVADVPVHHRRFRRRGRRGRRREPPSRATCSSSSSRRGPHPQDLNAFAAAFDEGLCRQNRVYREHRRGGRRPPSAARRPPRAAAGHASSWKRSRAGNVQGKFPRIIDDTKKKLLWKHAARAR